MSYFVEEIWLTMRWLGIVKKQNSNVKKHINISNDDDIN